MFADSFPWLTTIFAIPLIAACAIPIIPDRDGKVLRWYACGVAIADFALMCLVFWQNYDPLLSSFQIVEKYSWIPQLGINWAVSVDGISMPLVLLAGFVTSMSLLSAWQLDRKPRMFYFLMLVLYAAQVGVFIAQDLLLFFIMWELELVPVYLLVCIWGGPKRQYAATKFLLYTAAASIFILIAALGLALSGGGPITFDIAELGLRNFPLALEIPLYLGLVVAFGVKLAAFPFHTWLPDAHGEASAPVSTILAGVLLKMGAYGLLRFNMGLLADAHVYFAPVLVTLGAVNIVYGALSSFAQTNMKRRLAYSSVSHMGFVLIGIGSFTDLGVNGAMLQMLSHGLIASVLFFLTGVTYDRTQTMTMKDMGGIGLLMPKVFALYSMGAMASVALPGLSGFASEVAVFIGIATSDFYSVSFRMAIVFLGAVGVILTPIYMLSMVRQVFYGSFYGSQEIPSCDLTDPELRKDFMENQAAVCFGTNCVLPGEAGFGDSRPREVAIAVCFLVLSLGIGCYPKLAMQVYDTTTVAINGQVTQAYTEFRQQSAIAIGDSSTAPSLKKVAEFTLD
ncbi:NAD(P)H-quinone oxidoreductase subunit 4 [Oxynema sp. CENA135]|uniref:NAD(P)H-quinone oxidoreductase subunit 4 n=1 Tax=Oxynema sp. CENA135 TaxID=984206 RepID=UPI00190A3FC5|nr:NAD(P)H-quinone oxidoreductase subunit 4 [Oxynema sp. CENA135]MBK4730433.1 NAD(P)H-quinone oxidoreductase subunit 4 [Oxynema sp. CENA135]